MVPNDYPDLRRTYDQIEIGEMASFFTTLIATRLPGIEGIYVSQEIKFIRPVRIGDMITAQAKVIEKDDIKRRITLKTTVTNQHGELIIDGKGVVAVLK